jgi:hypothetical protein
MRLTLTTLAERCCMKLLLNIIKSPWLWGPISIVTVAIIGFFAILIYGAFEHGRSAQLDTFPAIVHRAVVDQGEEGRRLTHLEDLSGYQEMGRQFANLPKGFLEDWGGDCSLPLNFVGLDPYRVPGTFTAKLSLYRTKVIVFFFGPVPDVTAYLDPANAERLLSSRMEHLRTLPFDQYEKLRPQFTWVDGRLMQVVNSDREVISWRGEQCETYSYIIFEGKRK